MAFSGTMVDEIKILYVIYLPFVYAAGVRICYIYATINFVAVTKQTNNANFLDYQTCLPSPFRCEPYVFICLAHPRPCSVSVLDAWDG